MLYYALVFLVIALIAGVLGVSGVAGGSKVKVREKQKGG